MSIKRGSQGRLFAEHAFDSRPTFTSHGLPLTPAATFEGNAPGPTAWRSTNNQAVARRFGLLPGRQVKVRDIGNYAANPHEEQLRMFMKPHEILATHGPNDADRHWTDQTDMVPTRSRHDSQGFTRMGLGEYSGGGNGNFVQEHTAGGTPLFVKMNEHKESDEELWDRKYQESWDPQFGPPDAVRSLAEEMKSGNVPGTITLGTARTSTGQRVIAGGHHRIAAAMTDLPDRYLPVEHVEGGVKEAKKQGRYSSRGYT